MDEFTIDVQFVTDVSVTKEYRYVRDDLPEDEQIVRALLDLDKSTSYSSIDHPVFNELRVELAEKGFIDIRRNCWNGDSTLKPFKLNNKIFNVGDRFFCAAALKHML